MNAFLFLLCILNFNIFWILFDNYYNLQNTNKLYSCEKKCTIWAKLQPTSTINDVIKLYDDMINSTASYRI